MIVIEHQDAFEAEIAAIGRARVAAMRAESAAHQERGTELGRQEREIKERLAMAEAARAASLTVFERGQRRA